MTTNPVARRRLLPKGRVDLARQTGVWLGFALAYQLARGLTRRDVSAARAHGREVLDLEHRLRIASELRLQRSLLDLHPFVSAINATYWLSQFVVVGLALLWIYVRRYEWFLLVRDAVIATNTAGLAAYVALPTAPPRLLPGGGFVDTLRGSHWLNHGSGIVELAENPYAAIPSLHTADALIVGVALAVLVKPVALKIAWLCWPAWVALALVVSGNHYWIDVAAGAVLVVLVVPAVVALERRLQRVPARSRDSQGRHRRSEGAGDPRAVA